MANSIARRKKRFELWNINPNCYYCGNPTVLPPYDPYLKIMLPNYATIEHLYNIHHPLRRGIESLHLTVLACFQCNQKKGHLDIMKQTCFLISLFFTNKTLAIQLIKYTISL